MKKIAFLLIAVFFANSNAIVFAQTVERFGKIEMIVQNGNNVNEKSVIVTFNENSMTVKAENSSLEKTFNYSEIISAEYSYSKNPRWKTGLGLGAAAFFLFPPILFVAIPLGFSKHRRHWLTVRTENDYAVLKLNKSTRKLFIPAFETKSGVRIEAVGEDK